MSELVSNIAAIQHEPHWIQSRLIYNYTVYATAGECRVHCAVASHRSLASLSIHSQVLVLYEYAITFADEVRTVWERPKTITSLLFIFTRWTMVLTAIYRIIPATTKVSIIYTLLLPSWSLSTTDVMLLFWRNFLRTYQLPVAAGLKLLFTTFRFSLWSSRLQVRLALDGNMCDWTPDLFKCLLLYEFTRCWTRLISGLQSSFS